MSDLFIEMEEPSLDKRFQASEMLEATNMQ